MEREGSGMFCGLGISPDISQTLEMLKDLSKALCHEAKDNIFGVFLPLLLSAITSAQLIRL